MKKKLLLFVLLFAGLMSVRAQEAQERKADGALDIENIINVVPGYSVNGQFDVVLTNLNTADNTAFQFDIVLPAGFSYKGYEAGELLDGHNVTDGSVDNNDNYRRFTAANHSGNKPFKALQGVLLTIKFSVAAGTELGDKTINVKNAILTRNGDSWRVADFDKNIAVNRTITLDENETSAPVAIANVNVTVKRHLKAGWNTIILPFPVPAEQVETVFGAGTEIGEFIGNDAVEESGKIVKVKINFETKTSMEPHIPYIIKVPDDMDEFTVSAVDITTTNDDLIIEKGTRRDPKNMTGTYVTNTSIPKYCMFLSDNKFMFSKGQSKLKAFRAYFEIADADALYNATASGNAPAISFGFIDGSATFINTLEAKVEDANTPQVYYTLSGQRVTNPTRGLYIVNGRKVVIK